MQLGTSHSRLHVPPRHAIADKSLFFPSSSQFTVALALMNSARTCILFAIRLDYRIILRPPPCEASVRDV